jgi:hypothetical protein
MAVVPRTWKRLLPAAVCGVTATMWSAGCSSSPQAWPTASAASATDAVSGTVTASPASPTAEHYSASASGTIIVPTNPCMVPDQSVAKVTGHGSVSSEPLNLAPDNAPELFSEGCKYVWEGTSVAALGVTIGPAAPGMTAQQYLANEATSGLFTYSLQNLPDLGDAAEFGSAPCGQATCSSVAAVEIRAGTAARILVSVTGPATSQDPPIALARAMIAAITH